MKNSMHSIAVVEAYGTYAAELFPTRGKRVIALAAQIDWAVALRAGRGRPAGGPAAREHDSDGDRAAHRRGRNG